MKYILYCLAGLAFSFGIGYLIVSLLTRKKNLSKGKKAGLSTLCGILVIALLGLGYLEIYYHAEDTAMKALEPDSAVKVEKTGEGYLFDGPGTEKILVFYPGAKVETESYAPLMRKLAENGVDAFLADMPFRMAMFGSNVTDKLLERYDYAHWYTGGHSLGGVAASGYAAKHADKIEGVVLLASYSAAKFPEGLDALEVYGTEDKVMNKKAYQDAMMNLWRISVYEIKGGNHAQFGNYGAQKGDGTASITAEEQQNETVKAILGFMGE